MSLLGLTIETTGQNITLNATASVAAAASNVTTGATGKIASLLDTTGFNITSQLMESHDINTSAGVNGHISYNNTAANKSDPLLFGLPKMDNFVDIFSICCSVAVIFGGLIPYIPQYLKIKRSANSDGFSTYVCLTLFIANILRIMFWFGHHFEPPLLIQSFVMIAGMLAMMELCVRVKDKRRSFSISAIGLGGANHRRRRSLIGSRARDFWDWDDFFSYIQFISLFTIIMSLLTYLLVDYYLYVETLGYVAVFTEAMLGIPQLIKNHTQKSTLGMSVEMVIMWLSGDLFKTLYFIIKRTPAQFYACGSIQVLVDILILYQVLHFRKPKVTYRKLPESG